MILQLKKFGKILNSRSFGREAVLRAQQIVNGEKDNPTDLILDFSDVDVVTPSFADEFISGLKNQYPQKKVKLQGTENNPVLQDMLRLIEKETENSKTAL